MPGAVQKLWGGGAKVAGITPQHFAAACAQITGKETYSPTVVSSMAVSCAIKAHETTGAATEWQSGKAGRHLLTLSGNMLTIQSADAAKIAQYITNMELPGSTNDVSAAMPTMKVQTNDFAHAMDHPIIKPEPEQLAEEKPTALPAIPVELEMMTMGEDKMVCLRAGHAGEAGEPVPKRARVVLEHEEFAENISATLCRALKWPTDKGAVRATMLDDPEQNIMLETIVQRVTSGEKVTILLLPPLTGGGPGGPGRGQKGRGGGAGAAGGANPGGAGGAGNQDMRGYLVGGNQAMQTQLKQVIKLTKRHDAELRVLYGIVCTTWQLTNMQATVVQQLQEAMGNWKDSKPDQGPHPHGPPRVMLARVFFAYAINVLREPSEGVQQWMVHHAYATFEENGYTVMTHVQEAFSRFGAFGGGLSILDAISHFEARPSKSISSPTFLITYHIKPIPSLGLDVLLPLMENMIPELGGKRLHGSAPAGPLVRSL